MKKITRATFEGLRRRYPVLHKEEMRRYVVGNSTTLYDESDLALLNVYTLDIDMDACSAVGSDKDDEIEEDVWTSDLGISAFSADDYGFGGYSFYGNSGSSYDSSYGYGGYGWDIDYGYLDEVVIYGHKPDNNYYSGTNGYPGWGDGYGYGDSSYWGYDYYDINNDEDNKNNAPTDCVAHTLAYLLNRPVEEISEWIEAKYGKEGVPGNAYYEVLDHFLVGAPANFPFDHYNMYTSGRTLIGVVGHPQIGGWHSVTIVDINGQDVVYMDNQNGNTWKFCKITDIRRLYQVNGFR